MYLRKYPDNPHIHYRIPALFVGYRYFLYSQDPNKFTGPNKFTCLKKQYCLPSFLLYVFVPNKFTCRMKRRVFCYMSLYFKKFTGRKKCNCFNKFTGELIRVTRVLLLLQIIQLISLHQHCFLNPTPVFILTNTLIFFNQTYIYFFPMMSNSLFSHIHIY